MGNRRRGRSIWRHRDGQLKAPSVAAILAALIACVVAVVVVVGMLPGRSSGVDLAEGYTPPPMPTQEPRPRTVTFAGVGDSVTNGDSVDFAGGNSGSLSWATYASSDARKFVGGFASGGAESDEMLARAVPVAADVLVVMAGTNDSGHSVPYDVINSNILGVVQGMNIDHVVICAIPPRDSDTEISSGFNAQLQEFVVAQGWTWVDPWAPSRDPETGAWLPGLTSDGIHPVQTAAETAGGLIGEAITAAVPAN